MTSHYEEVHDNTYLWLYTVMFRVYGDRMKNLLTDDTSNLYERDEPVLIEYASVILFESDDPDIPTTVELDALVTDAFTGANGDAYVDGLQSLPRDNPFRYVLCLQLFLIVDTLPSQSILTSSPFYSIPLLQFHHQSNVAACPS